MGLTDYDVILGDVYGCRTDDGFILKSQAKAETEMAAMREHHARYEAKSRREMDAIRTLMRAGMKMIVKNNELVKEVAAAQKEVAKAQKLTEAKLQGDSLRRGGNGYPRN